MPANWNDLNEVEQDIQKGLYRRRLVHYHYIRHTEKYNQPHHKALNEPSTILRRRLFHHAGEMWEGETVDLKIALIDATRNWRHHLSSSLASSSASASSSCPVVFDTDDVRATLALSERRSSMDETTEACQDVVGVNSEGWVSNEDYEGALQKGRMLKSQIVAAVETGEVREEVGAQWFLDDMDEEVYM